VKRTLIGDGSVGSGMAGVDRTGNSAVVTGEVMAYLDRAKMSQVIYNLVSNGLKFTPPGGSVTVEATLEIRDQSSSSVYAKIAVTDTGVGLSKVKPVRSFVGW